MYRHRSPDEVADAVALTVSVLIVFVLLATIGIVLAFDLMWDILRGPLPAGP